MSRKGGYKIIDLKGLDFNQAMVIDGIHESIEENYRKPLLFTGIVIDGVEKDDVFTNVVVNGDGYDVTLYGQRLHISNVDVVSFKSNVIVITETNENTLKTLNNGVYRINVLEGVEYKANKSIIGIGEFTTIDSIFNSNNEHTIAFNTNVQDMSCIVLNECILFGAVKDEF